MKDVVGEYVDFPVDPFDLLTVVLSVLHNG